MKIFIPTNDRETIAKRTGRASEFAIYTIENKEIQSVEYQKNTHSHDHDRDEGNHGEKHGSGHGKGKKHNHDHNHDHDHEHGEHSHDDLLIIFKEADILLLRAIGKYMRKTLQKGNIPYQLVKIDNISEIISNYLAQHINKK